MPSFCAALSTPVIRLLDMGIAGRIYYGLVAVYLATFLGMSFVLSVDAAVLPLVIFAIGNTLGRLGGRTACGPVRRPGRASWRRPCGRPA